MADAIVELAAVLSPGTALKLASSLEIDQNLEKAVAKLPQGSPAIDALRECYASLGPAVVASMLRAFERAASGARREIRAVWSGPTFEGDGDHTTSALSHLIDDAVDDVFASTYSATPESAFVNALWRAIARGVNTTLLVDSKVNDGKTAAMLRSRLGGARFWTFTPPDADYGRQHSKVVIVDSRIALVTSANLSDAAVERNLEAGVVIRDAEFASKMRQTFTNPYASGAVRDL